jgi:hypothetical protein
MNKIDKLLANVPKIRREKTQINKIRNEKGEITTNNKELQGIIRDYLENLYSNALENLEEIVNFLDTHEHPKLTQEDIISLNRPMTCREVEAAVKTLPKMKSPGLDRLSSEFFQTFKEELAPTLFKCF